MVQVCSILSDFNYMNNAAKSIRKRIGGVVVAFLFAVAVLWLLDDQRPVEMVEEPEAADLAVTVIETKPVNARIEVNATGITMARWPTDITASVNGRVVEVANSIMPGSLVMQGETLVSLLDTFYQSEVKAAKARVSEAELNLAEILNRQYVAKKSNTVKSAFGRFEPHVRAAKANLEAAQSALVSAEQQLADSQIKAPFDAVVITDSVHPGEWINAGDVLFQVAASGFLDVKVELPDASWQRLNGIQQRPNAITIVTSKGRQWPASIRYLSPVKDPVTRQRSMMLQVTNPFQSDTPLLANQQVKVIFEGEEHQFVVNAPASILTEDGNVWSVVDKTLRLETIELLDEKPDFVLFRYQEHPEQKRFIVRFPLRTLLEGQSVSMLTF